MKKTVKKKNTKVIKAVKKVKKTPKKSKTKNIELEIDVYDLSNKIAKKNRALLQKHNIKTINIISSPGSGKTTLLEKTLEMLADKINIAILVGDQETDNDAKRLMNKGAIVKQINTISACHLDAMMIAKELKTLDLTKIDLLIIENIGNLVCPASFDLGEDQKIALLSTTEGEDKPEKYPVLFNNSQVTVITKSDLIPHLDWSYTKALESIYKVNPCMKIISLSAKSKDSLKDWEDFLLSLLK